MDRSTLLRRAIYDLRVLHAFYWHENVDDVPDIGNEYLFFNSGPLEFYVKQLYEKTTSDERSQLCKQSNTLDPAPVSGGFDKLVTDVLHHVTHIWPKTPARHLLRTSSDNIKVIIRALEYTSNFPLESKDYDLRLSPIDQHGLRNYLGREKSIPQEKDLSGADAIPPNRNLATEFLKRAWASITQRRTDPLPAHWLVEFIPPRVKGRLGSEVTIDDVIRACEAENTIAETFALTVSVLKRDWNELKPEAKRELIAHVEDCGMEAQFDGLPQLTFDDREALTIPWHISDTIYFEAKDRDAEECSKAGLDIKAGSFYLTSLHQRYPEAVDAVTSALMTLLKSRAETDLAVVGVAVGASRYKYIAKIEARLRREFDTLYYDLHEALLDFAVRINDPKPEYLALARITLLPKIEESLASFRAEFEDYYSNIKSVHPSPNLVDTIRRLTAEATMSVTQVTYNVTGDGNVVDNKGTVVVTINKELAASKSKELAEAFALLKADITRTSALSEKSRRTAIRAVEDAEEEAAEAKPNPERIEDHLKRVTSVLKESGQVFDGASEWGPRLTRLAVVLGQTIPAAWGWLSSAIT